MSRNLIRRPGWPLLLLSLSLGGFGLIGIERSAHAESSRTAPVQGYEVVRVYPHARDAFTQGLIFLDGYLYESTGLNGASSLRKVDLRSGRVLKRHDLDAKYFGEGLVEWGPNLIQLTLRAGTGFVYDRESFRLRQTFQYRGQGWGLTHDGRRLIMSDGSAILRFLDPLTFQETHVLQVHDGGRPVPNLNELEYVNGEIYANIWPTDRIVRIAPETGEVLGWVNLEGLLSLADRMLPVGELNGIAYDAARGRLFITGKRWPKLFEIRILPPS